MFKIITFTIIIFLIGLCIYLIATMFKPSKEEISTKQRSVKEDVEILVRQLKMKLKEAHEDAIAGKADAISKMTQYELELKKAEELLNKYN
jgi:uncharacterized membrane protein YgaE (UPF0421/DUF939 family)